MRLSIISLTTLALSFYSVLAASPISIPLPRTPNIPPPRATFPIIPTSLGDVASGLLRKLEPIPPGFDELSLDRANLIVLDQENGNFLVAIVSAFPSLQRPSIPVNKIIPSAHLDPGFSVYTGQLFKVRPADVTTWAGHGILSKQNRFEALNAMLVDGEEARHLLGSLYEDMEY